MQMPATRKWALTGAAFGLAFPVIAGGLRLAQFGLSGAADAFFSDPLALIICSAPFFLGGFAALGGRQQDRVTDLNAGLEHTVAERTVALEQALGEVDASQRAQHALLAALERGLVTFDRTGRLSEARTPTLSAILPDNETCTTIEALLARYARIDAETTTMVRELLWDPAFWSTFQDTVALLNKRFEHNGRTLQTRFQPVRHNGDGLDEVLLEVVDVTQQVRAEADRARAAELEKGVPEVALAALGLAAGSQDAAHDQSEAERNKALALVRNMAALCGFPEVLEAVDRMECGAAQPESSAACGADTLVVDRLRFEGLLTELPEASARAVGLLLARPMSGVLPELGDQVAALAAEHHKMVDLRLGPDPVFDAELPVLRKVLAPALAWSVRHSAHPDRLLTVRVHLERDARNRLEVDVIDDGPGIDHHAIVAEAVMTGALPMSHLERAEAADALPLLLSGPLAPLRDAVEQLGGQLKVSSERGRGTRLHLSLESASGGDLRAAS